MDAVTTHTGTAVPLRRPDVDTDQIIPAEWLKRVERTGFEKGLFVAWRERPDFVLNQPQYAGASILVAGPDFGTGSSREHAVWAIQDYGFEAVIAPGSPTSSATTPPRTAWCPCVLPEADVEALWAAIEADPATAVTVDLQAKQVTLRRHGRAVRARRLHPLAAARGARRRRPHRAAPRRHRGLRGAAPGLAARPRCPAVDQAPASSSASKFR